MTKEEAQIQLEIASAYLKDEAALSEKNIRVAEMRLEAARDNYRLAKEVLAEVSAREKEFKDYL